ncbi:hypothetical protein SK128_019208 [Halocaridina rubra]|uniref:Pyrroline-5-carboxylate reductase catalytic N-terminal domain-containing protein n=1 Tax=Halocaridina rubra TaxID=373956 RepID=A0AAN9A3M9_HALRR
MEIHDAIATISIDSLNSTRKQSDVLYPEEENSNRTVVLIGSGDMTMGLAINLLRAKYRPVIASRNPERARVRLKNMMNLTVNIATISEAVTMSNIIIVAIPSDYHHTLPGDSLRDKILIDISNRSPSAPSGGPSLAEHLQALFPESHVVKAFNTVSSYALSHGVIQGSKEVPICGDKEWTRNCVATMVRDMGFSTVDKGTLKNARAVEDIPLSFFPEWRSAFIICISIFFMNWILYLFWFQLCPNFESHDKWDWSVFTLLPLINTHVCISLTAAWLLLLTYMPGAFAAYLQLYRGTKYSQFPNWLDKWMKCRKQLGLLALLLGGDSCPILLAMLAILGVTSLPSVSSQLTWREFSFMHRKLGWISVFFLGLHGGLDNWGRLLDKLACVVIPGGSHIFVVLCMFTILLKIPLLLPCVDSHLTKIRNGYERNPPTMSPA